MQIHGTAMGPKNACSYADLAMGELDHKAKFCGPLKPALWWRYRDDIFDLWHQGPSALENFAGFINSLYPTIKFELVSSDSYLNMLDVTLYLIDGFIRTDIGYVIRKHLHLLQSNPKCREFFPSNSIIPSFRRTKNLKEILAPSKYRTRVEQETNETGGGIKCKRSRCDLCKNVLIESNFFQSFQTNRKYFIKPRLSCDSKNVIYLASCNKCRLQYVGSTATQFKVRFRNHKISMVTNKKTCEVAVHYNNSPHALNDFSFQCIDQVSATNCTEILDKLLITKEAYWSAQLFSLAPFGLNKRQEFHSTNRITYVIIQPTVHLSRNSLQA